MFSFKLLLFFFNFFSVIRNQGRPLLSEFYKETAIDEVHISNWIMTDVLPTNGLSPYPQTICSSQYNLFGGYQLFDQNTVLTRNFNGLSDHFEFQIYFEICGIDDWSNQNIIIKVDGVEKALISFPIITDSNYIPVYTNPHFAERYSISGIGWTRLYSNHNWAFYPTQSSNICGTSLSDICYHVGIHLTHSQNNLQLIIHSVCSFPPCFGYWGIRDFYSFMSSMTDPLFMCPSNCMYWTDVCKPCNNGNYIQRNFCTNYCFYGEIKDEVDKRCVAACPLSRYINVAGNCAACDFSCLTCNGPSYNECLSCNGTFLHLGICYSDCPLSFFGDETDHKCKNCDPSCDSCYGPHNTNCISCVSGTYLNYNGECSISCPFGYFANPTINKCELCDLTCETCSGNLDTNCISCPGNYLTPLNKCVGSCPDSTYVDLADMTCKYCYYNCLNCFGNSSTECFECQNGYFLKFSLAECVYICPTGYYGNIATKRCMPCDLSCNSCFGPLPNECHSCLDLFLTDHNFCLSTCPLAFYGNIDTFICDPCHFSCHKCSGPSNNQCIMCFGTYLNNLNECVDDCPIGFYRNSLIYVCSNCHISCLSCSGGLINECLTCNTGFNLVNNECRSIEPIRIECDTGFYRNIIDNVCNLCHLTCESCIGPLETDCISCNNLFPFFYIGTCINKCPNSYFSAKGICELCDPVCISCSGPLKTNCLQCINGNFLENGICVTRCSETYWVNNDTLTCEKCINPCLTCKSELICNTCVDSYIFHNERCVKLEIIVSNSVFEINNPCLFRLCFYSVEEIDIINSGIDKFIEIEIINMNKLDYSFVIINTFNKSCFDIKIEYLNSLKLVGNNNRLSISISSDIKINQMIFKKFNKEFILFSQKEKLINNYNWKYSDDSENTIMISFTYLYTHLISEILNYNFFNISIENFQYLGSKRIIQQTTNFNYNLKLEPDSQNIILLLKYSKLIIGDVYLNLITNIETINRINELNNTYFLQISNFKIKLLQYYNLSEESNEFINKTETVSQIASLSSLCLSFIDFIVRPGSSIAIRGLLAVDIIQLLKYVDINYPPNVVNLFKKGFSKIFFKSTIIDNENYYILPQILTFYRIYYDIINNIIDEIIVCIAVFIFSLISYASVGKLFQQDNKNEKKGFLKGFLLYVQKITVWNMTIGIIISKFFRIAFFMLISIRFFVLDDKTSISNLVIAFFLINFIFFFPILIIYVIQFHRNLRFKKQNPKNLASIKVKPIKTDLEIIELSKQETNSKEIYKEKMKKTVDWEKLGFYQTPTLQQKITKDVTLNETDSLKDVDNKKSELNSNFEENLGSTNISPKATIFKNLKITPDKKIFKLNNKKIWEISPLTGLNNLNITKNNPNNSSNESKKIKLKLVNKICAGILAAILLPFICGIKLVKLCAPKTEIDLIKFNILFRDLKNIKGIHNFYFCFELLRYFLLPCSTIAFYGESIAQLILLITINGIFFLVVLINPFRKLHDWILSILKEICINLAFISAILIAYCDKNNNLDYEYRMNLGWIITFCNIVLMMLILIHSTIYFGEKLWSFCRLIDKKLKNKNKIVPI